MKKILLTLGVLLVAIAIPLRSWLIEPLSAQDTPLTDVREGDVIFHTSQSSQSPLIQIGTRSHITHCGIVVIKDGKPFVLETLKTLVLTPLDKRRILCR